jgi:uncharacterized protein YcbX
MADCTGVITQLFIYPVKSCAGIEVNQSVLDYTGLQMDREWMIVDQYGMFLTQRQIPHMVWITPELNAEGLTLSAPGQADITIALDQRGPQRQVTVWRDTLPADDMGDAAAKWLDKFLAVPGKQFRLVRFSVQASRISPTQWTDGNKAPNMFSDGFAALVVTQSALDALNTRIVAAGHLPVSVHRFRPNIVIEGLDAHTEDDLKSMRIHTIAGLIELSMVKPCTRCPIPDIDPFTAQSSPIVSQTLQSYRSLSRMDGAICFGMNAIVHAGAGMTLHAGQPFEGDYAIE